MAAAYRKACLGFDPRKAACFDAKRERALVADAGIVGNRLKIEASVANAKAFLRVQKEYGSFARYAWSFVGSTITYAFMQATGLVNDHNTDCFRWNELR